MGKSLLELIHGVSLYDYAAISSKLTAGNSLVEILNAMGFEAEIYEKAAALWVVRMQEDKTNAISMEFGQYFSKTIFCNFPNFGCSFTFEKRIANLEKLKTDRYFFEELSVAKTAAYEYGLDGAHWVLENYGITLVDFQLVESQWKQTFDKNDLRSSKFQQEKQAEYAKKFAAEINDSIHF